MTCMTRILPTKPALEIGAPVSAPGATPRQSASEQRPKSCKSVKCLRLWLNTCITFGRNVRPFHHVRRLPRHMTNYHRATLHRLDTLARCKCCIRTFGRLLVATAHRLHSSRLTVNRSGSSRPISDTPRNHHGRLRANCWRARHHPRHSRQLP